MSSWDTGELIDQKEKELAECLKAQNVLDDAELQISRDILAMQLKKKDIMIAKEKGSYNIKKINLELRGLTRLFWKEKQGNA